MRVTRILTTLLLLFSTPVRSAELNCPEFYRDLLEDTGSEYILKVSVEYAWLNKEIKDDGSSKALYDLSNSRRRKLIEDLVQPCPSQGGAYSLCGFDSELALTDGQNDLILEKVIQDDRGVSLAVNGRAVRLRLKLTTVGPSEDRRTPQEGAPQYEELAASWFARVRHDIQEPGVILIWSHSRWGAGPDPYPIKDSLSGAVEYLFGRYMNSRMNLVLPEAGTELKGKRMLILATCTSEKYFGEMILKSISRYPEGPGKFHLGTTTKFLYDFQGELLIRGLISTLSRGLCPAEIEAALEHPTGYSPMEFLQFRWAE